jgi:hypothetical protein
MQGEEMQLNTFLISVHNRGEWSVSALKMKAVCSYKTYVSAYKST